jgi:RNA polymerase sigma factor (sigma-70 family)
MPVPLPLVHAFSEERPVADPAPPTVTAAELPRLYREHRQTLLQAARRLLGPAEAESVLQEVFVELLRNPALRARFSGGSMAAWLGEITRRKALEHLRRHGREIPGEAAVEGHASAEGRLQARNLIERFLARHVPEPQRRFFLLRFLERKTQVEAAAALGLPRSTLEGWEHRLGEALRRFIVEEG